MIKSDFNGKLVLQEFNSYLNKKIKDITKGYKVYMSEDRNRLLFVNDQIFRFIAQPHLVRTIDFTTNNKLTRIKKPIKDRVELPELNDSYLVYEPQNYFKESALVTGYEMDPFYLIWVEQIELYFKELKVLTEEYFGRLQNDNLSKPIEYFAYFNSKIVKLKRRAQLINILLEANPSIVYQGNNKDKKKTYIQVRCNWIDDCGDIDRNILFRVPEEIVDIPYHENSSKDYTNIIIEEYKIEMFSDRLMKIIRDCKLSCSIDSTSEYTKYYLNGKELDFTKPNISLAMYLSILEFEELYKRFNKIYK